MTSPLTSNPMDFGLRFAPSGNVTAETLGVPPPDCGPKAQPVLGPDGQWTCEPTPGAQSSGSTGRLIVLAGLAYVLFHIYKERFANTAREVKAGNLGALL